MATLEELRELVQDIVADQDEEISDDAIDTYLNDGVSEIAAGMDSAFGDFLTPPLPDLLTIDSVATDSIDAAYTTYAAVQALMSANDTLAFTYNDTAMTATLTGDYSTLQTDIDTALVAGGETADDVVVSWDSTDLILTCAGAVGTDTIVGGTFTDVDGAATVTPTDTVLVEAAAYVSMPTTFCRDLIFVANSSGTEINISNSWIEFVQSNPLLDRQGSIYEAIEQGGNIYYQGIPTTSENITLQFYRLPVDMSVDADTPDGIPLAYQKKLLVNYACTEIFKVIENGLEGPLVNTARYSKLFTEALRRLEMSIPADTRSLYLGEQYG